MRFKKKYDISPFLFNYFENDILANNMTINKINDPSNHAFVFLSDEFNEASLGKREFDIFKGDLYLNIPFDRINKNDNLKIIEKLENKRICKKKFCYENEMYYLDFFSSSNVIIIEQTESYISLKTKINLRFALIVEE